MKYVHYALLPCIALATNLIYASDNDTDVLDVHFSNPTLSLASFEEAPDQNDLQEVIIDGISNKPDGTKDFARELAEVLYGKACPHSKFCVDAFQQYLKKLKTEHRNKYNQTIFLIQKQTTQQHKRRTLQDTIDIPQELLSIALKAWKSYHHTQNKTIDNHVAMIDQHTQKIDTLTQSQGWDRKKLLCTALVAIGEGLALGLLGYLGNC